MPIKILKSRKLRLARPRERLINRLQTTIVRRWSVKKPRHGNNKELRKRKSAKCSACGRCRSVLKIARLESIKFVPRRPLKRLSSSSGPSREKRRPNGRLTYRTFIMVDSSNLLTSTLA